MDREDEFKKVAHEFREFDEQMKNPLVVGALLHKLSEERSSSNLLLKLVFELSTINRKSRLPALVHLFAQVLSNSYPECFGIQRLNGGKPAADVSEANHQYRSSGELY